MLSQVGCAEEDAEVDPQLGYPPVYAKLCRHADAAGLPMPFIEGPPQRFLPYAPHAEDFQHLKDWDSLFPLVAERERDSSNSRQFAEELWQQLDHLGNAGFDPSKFRVDPYGNVVYWNADPSSPLAWDIDHWFPSSRGGRTKLPNLRIVQWQTYLRKRNRLEFLVPWWDLQHGCSVNQFLSAFAAKNADFRKRSFALFFAGGEDVSVAREHVGECRPWPQHFREKKALCGLAAAAIVSVPKDNAEGEVRVRGHSSKGPTCKRHWSVEEEEAVKRGVTKFGPGSWKEIKEDDSTLANRSAVQIKEKFRLMRGIARNNGTSTGIAQNDLLGRQSAATTALQKELRLKIMREEERQEREEELAQLETTVKKLKLENEKERIKALELESLVKKSKHRVEKKRKLAESQSSYRLCLERVLRDTMHQTMSYKEQARLTQEACNVLIARLDCQKVTCEATENNLLQRHSKREALEAAGAGGVTLMHKKVVTQGRNIVDVSSCVSLHDDEEEVKNMRGSVLTESDTEDKGEDEVYTFRWEHQQANARKSLVRHAITVAMQVEDTKEAVDMSPWEVLPVKAKPPLCTMSSTEYIPDSRTRIRKSEEIASVAHHQYDADSETAESASDSDFADDEMSPPIWISKDGGCRDDSKLVSELSKFHDGPTAALRDFCTRNSKPGESDYALDHSHCLAAEPALDAPIPSAGETSRSDSKREVQKDVIMVQTESSAKYESIDTAASYKQEYLDELLKQIRFQIPTAEVKGTTVADNPPKMSEGHLDELLEQVLATHLVNMRRNEARHHQSTDRDDERLKHIGKSNLDKWLQALLFNDAASAASPGRDTPLQLHSPALSRISIADTCETLELARHEEFVTRDGDNGERPKSSWGALLRKLSMKHQSEHQSMLFESCENGHEADNHDADIADAMKSLVKTSPNNELATKHSNGTLAEGRRSSDDPQSALPVWPGEKQHGSNGSTYGTMESINDSPIVWKTERRVEDGVPSHTLDFAFSEKRHNFPLPLSDVDEASGTESGENANRNSNFTDPDKDPNKPRKSVSVKVAGFVGWKKSSKKVDTRSHDEPASTQMD